MSGECISRIQETEDTTREKKTEYWNDGRMERRNSGIP
jgi:hypothetical protein